MSDKLQSHVNMFANRLTKNWRRLQPTAKRLQVTCFRIYDADIPEIPLVIDWYEGRLHVGYFSKKKFASESEENDWLEAMLKATEDVLELSDEQIYLKTRRRQKGSWQYSKMNRTGERFVVHEGGLKFYVNLTDYLDTGLFLDHRITRDLVRQEARGKRVLNLFAYTGSFSVYAVDGGAKSVHTLDMSNTYLRWAMDNFKLNDMAMQNHAFTRVDVLSYLKEPATEKYDLIVLDPPTFSNSKKMQDYFEVQRDHVGLIEDCLKRLNRGGILYFSTNFRNFQFQADDLKAKSIDEITRKTIPFDFQHTAPHRCWRIVH